MQSIRVSEELEGDVLRDRAPESAELSVVPAGSGPQAGVTVVAVGPALGSMDGRKVDTTLGCDATGVLITATTTRSAEYRGAVLKNVLWRPRLEIVLAPRPTGTVLTTTWKMRLTTGAEVQRTRTPPYPEEVTYPVHVTIRVRPGGTSDGVANKTDQRADGNGTGGVTITSVRRIMNDRSPGAATVGDITPPTITARATPSILWPPNGEPVTVTVSGTIRDNEGGSGVNPRSAGFYVFDQYGQVRLNGSLILGRDGSYSFTVMLPASCKGDDPNGHLYSINVTAPDNAGNSGAAPAHVTVPCAREH